MSTRLSAGRVPAIYEFIKAHQRQFSVEMLCRLLEVNRSGYYKWLKNPVSKRAQEDARLLRSVPGWHATAALRSRSSPRLGYPRPR
jgi:putative transposase